MLCYRSSQGPHGPAEGLPVRKNNVWKPCASLYRLKISPKKWNDKFTQEIARLEFTSNDLDPCLFLKFTPKGIVAALLYVDDILLMGHDNGEIEKKNS